MTNEYHDRAVIFEDDNIRVIIRRGISKFLLVTFGDLTMPAHGMKFFGDTPVEKENITCLGFMAKSANWYPRASVDRALDICNDTLAKYEDIIGYGGSMGGYAAIKYSRCINATTTIALCPQWSINGSECGGVNPGWQNYFNADYMASMGIRKADCGGDIFIFYDTYNALDTFHAEKIRENCSAKLIPVPRVDHHVTGALAGTGNLMNLINFCRANDVGGLRQLVRICRIRNPYRVRNVTAFAEKRFKSAFYSALTKRINDGFRPDLEIQYVLTLMYKLLETNERDTVAELFTAYIAKFEDFNRALTISLYIEEISGMKSYLASYHNTLISYDLRSNCLVHWLRSELPKESFLIPVKFKIKDGKFCFYIKLASQIVYVYHHRNSIMTSIDHNDEIYYDVEFTAQHIQIKKENRYMSVDRLHREIKCNQIRPQEWERFSIALH